MVNVAAPRKSLVGVIVDGIEGGPDKAVEIVIAQGGFSALELALGTFPTQADAAKALGMTPALLSKWLRTKTIDEWPIGAVRKLAALSKIQFDRIMNGSPQLPLPSTPREETPSPKPQRARKNGK